MRCNSCRILQPHKMVEKLFPLNICISVKELDSLSEGKPGNTVTWCAVEICNWCIKSIEWWSNWIEWIAATRAAFVSQQLTNEDNLRKKCSALVNKKISDILIPMALTYSKGIFQEENMLAVDVLDVRSWEVRWGKRAENIFLNDGFWMRSAH